GGRGSAVGVLLLFFFLQAEDGIRDGSVTGVQTCALPISAAAPTSRWSSSVKAAPSLPCLSNSSSTTWTPGATASGAASSEERPQIGRASCRERVESSGGAVAGEENRSTARRQGGTGRARA